MPLVSNSNSTVKFTITIDAECPDKDTHTPCPTGYLSWHLWAEKMSKTHKSIKCPSCGRYGIWVPKKKEQDMVGKRVEIIGRHPHAGKVGTVESFDHIEVLDRHMFRIKLDDGGGCYARLENMRPLKIQSK